MSQYHEGKDSTFWQQYIRGRPIVPDSFFDSIFQYHRNKGGELQLLHEAGAGPGVHTRRLATHFEKAIISDIAPQSIKIAEQNCHSMKNLDFRAINLEDDLIENGKVDMIVCLNMLHLCDFDKVMASIHRQLKPGGTFVYGFFAWPAFPDCRNAQETLEKMCRRGIAWLREVKGRDVRNSLALFVSNGDKISSDGFHHVVRQRVNFPQGFTWEKMLLTPDFILESWQKPREEEVQYVHDEGWAFELDIDGLRENLASHPWGNEPGLLDDLWLEMQSIMGKRKIKAVWPVTCIMATNN